MRSVFFICLLLFTGCVNAQTGREGRIDSLENLLTLKIHDTTRVHVLSELARTYGGVDSVKCFQNGFAAIKLSKEIGYLKGMAKAHIDVAGGYLDYVDPENAKKYFYKGNAFANKLIKKDSTKENMKIWLRGQYNLGVAYGYEGNVEKEIELATKTIPIAEMMGDKMFVANGNTNLAIKYNNLSIFDKAYELFMIGQKQFEEIGGPEDIVYHSLAFSPALFSMDSLSRMKEVLELAKKNLDQIPNSFYQPSYYGELGLYYGGVKEYEKGIAALNKSHDYFDNNSTSYYLRLLYQRYADIYDKMGNHSKAREYTLKYLNFWENKHSKEDIVGSYFRLAKHEANLKDFERAYFYLKDYIVAIDSMRIENLGSDMQNLEAQYQIATKEKEILALRNEKNEAALSLEKKKSQAYLLGVIISILALLLFSGYYFYNRKLSKARKKELIKEAEMNLLKQEQQNKIFSAMIEGQEKERKRLAIDLHDGLGGRLSGISMNLSKLDKDEPKQYPKKQLQKVMKDLNDSLTELRSIARNMMPETLVKFGLQAALKDYCSSMTGSNTKVTLQFYGTDKGININQQVTMYRVIQELINNAIKHAKATEVLVQFMREGNQVDITVEDNGVGFNQNESLQKKGSGMGLSNLQTRVAYLKGNIDFESEKNEGTTVNVHINIDAA
ncbi:MAG: sensor histidine kinase [Maribacter sp.]|uniref:tetratricopeptide repeat-containing sensor histidine kinase n=1 Tax=Maribacter sp. TaxID=1897614 RepID=UPI003297E2F3